MSKAALFFIIAQSGNYPYVNNKQNAVQPYNVILFSNKLIYTKTRMNLKKQFAKRNQT